MRVQSRPAHSDLPERSSEPGSDAAPSEASLFRQYAARIRLYGLRHLGSETAAADLVQVVLVRVLEALRSGRVESPDRLGAYVLGVCRYAAYDLRRAEHRQRAIESQAEVLSEHAPPPSARPLDVARLYRCLGKLSERDSTIVRLSFSEDRSADEIARHLGLTAGNVRVLRHRTLARLSECLEQGGGE